MDEAKDSPIQDSRRLDALARSGLLDSEAEETFDRLSRLAAAIFHAPIALVALVDQDRQFFKSSVGLPEPWRSRRQTPLSHSFCKHVVESGKPLIVDNAPDHPLVCDNLAITEMGVIAYLGVPLTLASGETLGSFCVIDTVPRKWTAEETAILRDLAASVMTEVSLRAEVAQRRRAEQRLRLLESVVLHANDAVLITEAEPIDEPGPRIVFANQAFERTTGYRAAEVLGRTPRLLQGPRTDRAELDRIRHALSRWQPVRAELINYRKDGSEFWVEIVIVPLADENGWYTHWVSIQRDVTDRKQSEQDLRESEECFRLLVNATPDLALFILDTEGRVASWNPGAERLKGYRTEEVVGRHYSLFFTAEDRAADRPARGLRTAEAEGRYEAEGWRVRGDGALYWASVLLTPLRGPAGQLVGFAKVTRNATARKRAEDALRASEAQNRAVLEAALDCIITIDDGGCVVEFNPAAERTFGYRRQDIANRSTRLRYCSASKTYWRRRRCIAGFGIRMPCWRKKCVSAPGIWKSPGLKCSNACPWRQNTATTTPDSTRNGSVDFPPCLPGTWDCPNPKLNSFGGRLLFMTSEKLAFQTPSCSNQES